MQADCKRYVRLFFLKPHLPCEHMQGVISVTSNVIPGLMSSLMNEVQPSAALRVLACLPPAVARRGATATCALIWGTFVCHVAA